MKNQGLKTFIIFILSYSLSLNTFAQISCDVLENSLLKLKNEQKEIKAPLGQEDTFGKLSEDYAKQLAEYNVLKSLKDMKEKYDAFKEKVRQTSNLDNLIDELLVADLYGSGSGIESGTGLGFEGDEADVFDRLRNREDPSISHLTEPVATMQLFDLLSGSGTGSGAAFQEIDQRRVNEKCIKDGVLKLATFNCFRNDRSETIRNLCSLDANRGSEICQLSNGNDGSGRIESMLNITDAGLEVDQYKSPSYYQGKAQEFNTTYGGALSINGPARTALASFREYQAKVKSSLECLRERVGSGTGSGSDHDYTTYTEDGSGNVTSFSDVTQRKALLDAGCSSAGGDNSLDSLKQKLSRDLTAWGAEVQDGDQQVVETIRNLRRRVGDLSTLISSIEGKAKERLNYFIGSGRGSGNGNEANFALNPDVYLNEESMSSIIDCFVSNRNTAILKNRFNKTDIEGENGTGSGEADRRDFRGDDYYKTNGKYDSIKFFKDFFKEISEIPEVNESFLNNCIPQNFSGSIEQQKLKYSQAYDKCMKAITENMSSLDTRLTAVETSMQATLDKLNKIEESRPFKYYQNMIDKIAALLQDDHCKESILEENSCSITIKGQNEKINFLTTSAGKVLAEISDDIQTSDGIQREIYDLCQSGVTESATGAPQTQSFNSLIPSLCLNSGIRYSAGRGTQSSFGGQRGISSEIQGLRRAQQYEAYSSRGYVNYDSRGNITHITPSYNWAGRGFGYGLAKGGMGVFGTYMSGYQQQAITSQYVGMAQYNMQMESLFNQYPFAGMYPGTNPFGYPFTYIGNPYATSPFQLSLGTSTTSGFNFK